MHTTGYSGKKTGRLREEILREITMGNFSRGMLLPSEREMAAKFGVSYMTVRKAVSSLVEESYLERVPGVGTFVRRQICESKVQKTLGMIIPAWAAPENSDLIMYATEAAEASNYILKLFFVRSWQDRALMDAWNGCDALIVSPPSIPSEMSEAVREKLLDRRKPVVFLAAVAYQYGFDTVMGSWEWESNLLLDKVMEAGHRRIALLEQRPDPNVELPPVPTLRSIWQARVGQLVGEEMLGTLDLSVDTPTFRLPHQAVYDKLTSLKRPFPFTVIVSFLSFAWGIVAAFDDMGVKIPDDVSLVLLGERQEMSFYRPRFACVSAPAREHVFGAIEVIRQRELRMDAPPIYRMITPVFTPGMTLKNIL